MVDNILCVQKEPVSSQGAVFQISHSHALPSHIMQQAVQFYHLPQGRGTQHLPCSCEHGVLNLGKTGRAEIGMFSARTPKKVFDKATQSQL